MRGVGIGAFNLAFLALMMNADLNWTNAPHFRLFP